MKAREVSDNHPVFRMSFASVYPHYVTKAKRKGRAQSEVDKIIRWQTGYTQGQLQSQLKSKVDFRGFFKQAPALNPLRKKVTGVVCGKRVEEIKHPLMREIRCLDKMIDELAKGKSMDKILRS